MCAARRAFSLRLRHTIPISIKITKTQPFIEATRWLPPEAVILIAGPGEQPEWTEMIEVLKPRQRVIVLPYTDRSLALYLLLDVVHLAIYGSAENREE